MTTEISSSLTQAGLGVSTGRLRSAATAIIGSTTRTDAALRADERPKRSSSTPEPGGRMEAQLSEWVKETTRGCRSSRSWRQIHGRREMKGMSFGHAGTIVEGVEDTATEKIARLEAAGSASSKRIDQIPTVVKEKLGVLA